MNTKSNFKRVIALTLAITCLSTSMVGCGKKYSSPIEGYDHVQMLSYDQVKKNAAKDLRYDRIVQRENHVDDLAWQDVDGEKAEQLKSLVSSCENVLAADRYEADKDTKKIIPKNTYHYIKSTIDGYALTNSKISDIKGTLGYYYVDVEYDIAPQKTGKFKENVDMLGLNGTWVSMVDGSYSISNAYLDTAVYKLNKYFNDNRMPYSAAYQVSTGLLSIYQSNTKVKVREVSDNKPEDETEPETTEPTTQEVEYETVEMTDESGEVVFDDAGEVVYETVEVTQDATEPEEDEDEEDTTEEETKAYEEVDNENTPLDLNPNAKREPLLPGDIEEGKENSMVPAERKIKLDVNFVNNVVGYSLSRAYLPELSLVYSIPKKDGDICGFGIYPEGINGLQAFDYDRSKMTGKCTIRYMFKDTVTGNGKMTGYDIFVKDIEINNGIGKASEDNEVATFTMDQLQNAIDRSDRVIANCDIPGIITGSVYEDLGYGVLRAYKDQSTNVMMYMSTIRQVLQRDTTNHCYLLDVETTTQDGSKAADCYATFVDKYLVVVQQQGENFVISDSLRYSRKTKTEPVINPDSATQKRLMALNLSGKIPDETKEELGKLLGNLYTAVNVRLLRGEKSDPDSLGNDGKAYEFGIYDCFNSDTSMVSTDQFLDMTSVLTDSTTKLGAGSASTIYGRPTQWIGGTKNQAEFITAEFISYEGYNEGYFAEVYYLVSKMGDYWVIDERRIIDEMMITDPNDYETYKAYATSSSAQKPNKRATDENSGDAAPAEDAPVEGGDAAADENAGAE